MKILRTTGKYTLDVVLDDDWADKLEYARLYGSPAKDQPGVFYVTVLLPGRRPEYLHRIIMDAPDGMEVDHLDYDTLNNQRSNLAIVTVGQNRQRRRYAPGSSGLVGVHAETRNGDMFYRAKIKVAGKRIDLGRSGTAEGAARIYDAGAVEHYGENARVNFPGEVLSLAEAREKFGRNLRPGPKRGSAPRPERMTRQERSEQSRQRAERWHEMNQTMSLTGIAEVDGVDYDVIRMALKQYGFKATTATGRARKPKRRSVEVRAA